MADRDANAVWTTVQPYLLAGLHYAMQAAGGVAIAAASAYAAGAPVTGQVLVAGALATIIPTSAKPPTINKQ